MSGKEEGAIYAWTRQGRTTKQMIGFPLHAHACDGRKAHMVLGSLMARHVLATIGQRT
jgi:hypothetical protein